MTSWRIRNCEQADVVQVRQLVAEMPPLDVHSAFTYWTLFTYSRDLCYLAISYPDGIPRGFVSGVISSSDRTIGYLWQLGVHKSERDRSLSRVLVHTFIASARQLGIKRLQLSIDPANIRSRNLFKRMVYRLQVPLVPISEINFIDTLDGRRTHEILYEVPLC